MAGLPHALRALNVPVSWQRLRRPAVDFYSRNEREFPVALFRITYTEYFAHLWLGYVFSVNCSVHLGGVLSPVLLSINVNHHSYHGITTQNKCSIPLCHVIPTATRCTRPAKPLALELSLFALTEKAYTVKFADQPSFSLLPFTLFRIRGPSSSSY